MKSIFQHITSAAAQYMFNARIGTQVKCFVRFCGYYESLHGEVLEIEEHPHGKLLWCRNLRFNQPPNPFHACCPGWRALPLWVSTCGASGILCIHNNPELRERYHKFTERLETLTREHDWEWHVPNWAED